MLGPNTSFGVFFKPLIEEFGWSRALLSGAFSVSSIVQGFSGIYMGRLNDKLGPRVVMTICGLLIGVGLLLMSRINSAWQLYLFYVMIIGVGMGGSFTPMMSTVARWFVKRRSLITGIVSAGGGLSGFLLPPALTWLIFTRDWRFSYIVLGILVLVIVLTAAQFLRRDPVKMGLTPYGEVKGLKAEPGAGTAGLSLQEAVHTRQFWMAVTMFFCTAFSLSVINVHIVAHITDLGISATTAANILAVNNGSFIVGGIILGIFADRIGIRQGYLLSFIITAAALFWLLTIRETSLFYVAIVIFGLGSGGGNTMESPLVAELFGIKSHGFILGVCSLFFLLGSAVGPFIAGYVFDSSGSYQLAFIISALLCILGILMTLILRPIKDTSAGR